MATARRVRRRDRGLTPVVALPALAALAWALSAGRMGGMDAGPGAELGGLGWFLVTWALMMAAMMLPSLVPAAHAVRGGVAFVAGYLAAWTAAGAAAYAVVEAVRSEHLEWLAWDRAGNFVAAGAILAAAAYQLTAAKGRCLQRCRSVPEPVGRGASRAGGVKRGLRHGADCVGCCAGLMAALFALGVMRLTWMAVVAALIAAERLLSRPRPAVHVVAAVLALLAVWVAVAPGALPGFTVPAPMAGM